MTVPAVRPAPSAVATGTPRGSGGPGAAPPALAARFSELLKQRRPADPAPAPGALPIEPDEVTVMPEDTGTAAPAAAVRKEEPDDPCEVMWEAPAVAPAAATPWVLPDAGCRAAMREVALTIAGFCNDPAVAQGELWQVQMGLRADVVPDTTLHLALSPHWLTLRFHAADPAALDLLSRGREALVEVLENTLARKRDIAITFDPP